MIFYFSGTGNTRWAAKEVAAQLDDRLVNICDAGESEYVLAKDERIGFCFPVHGWQPPRIFRKFIERLTLKSDEGSHYCFAVFTCGDSIGETIKILNGDLAKKGIHVDFACSLTMPETYVCLPFMYTDTPEREETKKKIAAHDLSVYTEMIRNRESGFHIVKGATPRLYSYVIGAYFNARMITDKKFTVDKDICIHCRKCEKTCPTNNIVMTDDLPTWKHDGSCTCCLACYHHCPKHAINYGNITRKRGQYYFK